jgi:catechol 2,3-dioxygenase-like lactoylglutathione lyase family enzyme
MSVIAPETTVGAVELTVSDLTRSLDYYRRAVGLEILEDEARRARLGVGDRELLVLVEEPGARPAAGYTGLFHFALLVPDGNELAAWLAHAARDHVPLVGLSDHYVSEALYLSDPDGHGIEIYRDRPRSHWEGQVGDRLTTMPLSVTTCSACSTTRRRAVRRPARRHGDGPRALKVADIPSGRLLPRPPRLRSDGSARRPRRRSVCRGLPPPRRPTPGRAPEPIMRRPNTALRRATVVLPDDGRGTSSRGSVDRTTRRRAATRCPSVGNALLLAVP